MDNPLDNGRRSSIASFGGMSAPVSVQFTSLYGTGKHEPLCSVLKIDEVTILLDCGWNDTFDEAIVAPLRGIATEVDIVLLSHAGLEYCGALPYAVAKLGLTTNIFCTLPVQRMGQVTVTDAYIAASQCRDMNAFNLADVERVFGNIKPVRYQQELEFRGVKISAFRAGRTIGGSIWRVHKLLEEIVYAVDYNPKNDVHLNRAALTDFKRPSVLITDAYNLLSDAFRSTKDTDLTDAVFKTLHTGGNVLIPTDSAGRVLEIALRLDIAWQSLPPSLLSRGPPPALYVMSYTGTKTYDYAKTFVEWLNDKWSKQFDIDKSVPFAFRSARICSSLDDIRRDRSPKVVVSSLTDMTVGPAKDLFLEWCSHPGNTVLFTSKGKRGTLASVIRKTRKHGGHSEFILDVPLFTRTYMSGSELEEWLSRRKADRDREARDMEVRKRLDDERRELEVEARLHEDVAMESGSLPAEELEEGQVPYAEANARSFLFDVRHPMFSCDDDDMVTVTPYGEAVSADMFPPADNAGPLKSSGGNWQGPSGPVVAPIQRGDAAHAALPPQVVIDGILVPPKFVEALHPAVIRCSVEYVDVDGRADKQTVMALMEAVAPVTTVIIHGTPKSKEFLKSKCVEFSTKVIVPAPVTSVEVSSRTVMFQARIWDDVFSMFKFQQVGPFEAGYVDGLWDGDADSLALRPNLRPS